MHTIKAKDTDTRVKVCSAIGSKQIIEFYYHDGFRLAEPFCYGVGWDGEEVLRCYQVGGHSELGNTVGWKLFRASEISSLGATNERFADDRWRYEPDDSVMMTIYCRIEANKGVKMPAEEFKERLAPSNIPLVKLGTGTSAEIQPKKPRKLFTRSYIRMIKLARKLNQNKKISGHIYFYPTERSVVVKSIDLSFSHPLCEVNSRARARSSEKDREYREERWLEAYLINQAKINDWKLRLPRKESGFFLAHLGLRKEPYKEYRFLLYQLKFRRDIARGEKRGKALDLLLYDDEKQYLLVLAIKSQADKAILDIARSELGDYVTKLEELVEAGDIAEAFGLKEVKGIAAYIVWPRTDGDYDSGKYGLIEFDRVEQSWQKYKESGQALEIGFTMKMDATAHTW